MSETKKCDCQPKAAWTVLAVIGLFILILAGFLYRQGSLTIGSLSLTLSTGVYSKAEAQNLAANYINNVLLEGQTPAQISEFNEEKGVYKFKVSIEDQSVDSYLTKDGSLLFASAIEISQTDRQTENAATNTNAPAPSATANISASDNPESYLFTMSFCPYGNQAEDAVIPVTEILGDTVVEPHYVIYSNYQGGGPEYCLDSESKYCSMHGIQELNQDVRELCVWRDQQDKYWDFVDQINQGCTSKDVDACWEKVAKNVGLDTASIKTCQTNEAEGLLAKEVELNEKYGISGSPALVINGTEYNGSRSPENYKTALCSGYTTPLEGCSQTLSSGSDSTQDASCE